MTDQLQNSDYRHPCNTQEVVELVKEALAMGVPIRVRGSLHSERGSVLSDVPGAIHVMLDNLQGIRIDKTTTPPTVRVAGGVSLGGDPLMPAGNPQQDPAQSLFHQLHAAGYAVPVTGGITHQTISGFLATGADGGSLRHSFPRAVRAITYVNGLGRVITCRRGQDVPGEPPFAAVLTSLGLLGIVTEVELELEPTYNVGGMRSTQPVGAADFVLTMALPGGGGDGLSFLEYLRKKEYARALWWPEPRVERIEFWEARRLVAGEGSIYDRDDIPPQKSGVPSPLLQVVGTTLLRWIAFLRRDDSANGLILRALEASLLSPQILEALLTLAPGDADRLEQDRTWRKLRLLIADLLAKLEEDEPPPVRNGEPGEQPEVPSEFPAASWPDRLIAGIIELFVKLSPASRAPYRDDQRIRRRICGDLFRDPWHLGLPMDNPIDDELLPVTFTEIWVPLEHAQHALDALHERFLRDGLDATGTFTIELYGATSSVAWLSPAYGTGEGVLRIDPFWCMNERPDADPEEERAAREEYFKVFWQVLGKPEFGARLHWAKALPSDYDASTSQEWRSYPKLADFQQVRRAQDPHGLFLTEYWRRHLGIAESVIASRPNR